MVALIQQRLGKQAELPGLLMASVLIAAMLSLKTVGDSGADSEDWQQLELPEFWLGLLNYLFWLCHSLSGLLLMSGVTRLLSNRFPAIPKLGKAWSNRLQLVFAGVLGALCFAPFAGLLEYLFATQGFGDADADSLVEVFAPAQIASEFIALLPSFIVSWLLLNFSYQALQGSASVIEATPASAQQGGGSKSDSGLLGQLPPALGKELLVISSDLNYVHVTTRIGSTMVLYSLSRAAEELGDMGLQVHRSHWVSRAAVIAVRRTRLGLQIEVPDGSLIPVSRRKERLVREQFGTDFQRRSP